MSFQILSDLHSESNMKDALNAVARLTKKANILVVPGDIGSFYKLESMFTLFKKMLEKFEHVVYVPGNHEYYYPIDASTKRKTPGELFYYFKKGLAERPDLKNVNVLNRSMARIGDITFAGCTLWSDPSPLRELPPYVRLDMSINHYGDMHRRDLRWLHRVSKVDNLAKLVVVTHHAPSKKLLKPSSFVNRYWSLYASNLTKTSIFKRADVWIFGHTHNNEDVVFKSTRVVSNQLGKSADPCDIDTEQLIQI